MKSIAFLCFICAFGCGQTAVQGTHLQLEMIAPQQAVLFLVNGDGEVSYGGGLNAIEGKTTWHGAMNVEQQNTFDALISASSWLSRKSWEPIGKGVGKYKIRIRNGTIDNKLILPLANHDANTVYKLLQSVADKRFQATLDALPKPSVDAMLQNRGLGEDK